MGNKEIFLINIFIKLKEIIKLRPYELLSFKRGGSIKGGSVKIISNGIISLLSSMLFLMILANILL